MSVPGGCRSSVWAGVGPWFSEGGWSCGSAARRVSPQPSGFLGSWPRRCLPALPTRRGGGGRAPPGAWWEGGQGSRPGQAKLLEQVALEGVQGP